MTLIEKKKRWIFPIGGKDEQNPVENRPKVIGVSDFGTVLGMISMNSPWRL